MSRIVPQVPNRATRQIVYYKQGVWRNGKLLHGDQISQYTLSWKTHVDFLKSNTLTLALFFFVSFIYDTLYYVSVPRFQKPSHKVGVDPIKTDWEVVESSLYSPEPTESHPDTNIHPDRNTSTITSRHKHFHYKFTNVSGKR